MFSGLVRDAVGFKKFRSSNPIRASRRKSRLFQRDARIGLLDRKTFGSPPHPSPPQKTHDHTLQQLRCWLDMLPLLLLTASQRDTSCSPPASSAYRHPMAAVRVIDDLFATPLLLLCSFWRLSTSPNAKTMTMKGMRAPRAPNEHFARGTGATKTCA